MWKNAVTLYFYFGDVLIMEDIDLHAITVLSYEWGCAYAATWNQSNYELVEGCTIYSICQFAWGNASYFLLLLTAKNHIHTISIRYAYFLKVDFMVSVNVQFPSGKVFTENFGQCYTFIVKNIFVLFFLFWKAEAAEQNLYYQRTTFPPASFSSFLFLFVWSLFIF